MMSMLYMIYMLGYASLHRQNAVTAYLNDKQLLGFARQSAVLRASKYKTFV